MYSFLKLLIGISFLMIGCCCDFDWWNIGTGIRFFLGLIGAWLLTPKYGMGSYGFFIFGLIGYIWSIQSGNLFDFPNIITDSVLFSIDGMLKYSLRIASVIILILGWSDLKNTNES